MSKNDSFIQVANKQQIVLCAMWLRLYSKANSICIKHHVLKLWSIAIPDPKYLYEPTIIDLRS